LDCLAPDNFPKELLRMIVDIVIPARFASTRYPGKPLVPLRGATGIAKPLIQRSWEAAGKISGIRAVHVATDSTEIRAAAEAFGASVIMTSEACANGTERCADAVPALGSPAPDIVVNLQGDAPLTPPEFVTALVERMRGCSGMAVATPVVRCTEEHYSRLLEDARQDIVGGTSAVFGRTGEAHYFSKRLIPHFDRQKVRADALPAWLHIGVYAYSPAALSAYAAHGETELERLEGLEQLRFLDMGVPIHCVPVARPSWEIWELNNPADVARVEQGLAIAGLD
jgi:3-deoxy-manno-octulosonate cytidylyltransferase (CMP-KDO synthetase)